MIALFFENWLFILGPLAVFVVISIYLRIKRDELELEFDTESRGKHYHGGRTLNCSWRFSDKREPGGQGVAIIPVEQ